MNLKVTYNPGDGTYDVYDADSHEYVEIDFKCGETAGAYIDGYLDALDHDESGDEPFSGVEYVKNNYATPEPVFSHEQWQKFRNYLRD